MKMKSKTYLNIKCCDNFLYIYTITYYILQHIFSHLNDSLKWFFRRSLKHAIRVNIIGNLLIAQMFMKCIVKDMNFFTLFAYEYIIYMSSIRNKGQWNIFEWYHLLHHADMRNHKNNFSKSLAYNVCSQCTLYATRTYYISF